MGILTREQERAMFAGLNERKDFVGMQAMRPMMNSRVGAIPQSDPHIVQKGVNFFETRKKKAFEKDAVKKKQQETEKDLQVRKHKKEAHERMNLEERAKLLAALKAGNIRPDDYDRRIRELESEHIIHEKQGVLPKGHGKELREQHIRDVEKTRHPIPIMSQGSGYQRYNEKTEGFDSRLTYEEQKALGVEKPTMTVPIKEAGGQYYNMTIPVVSREELAQEMQARKEDATTKATNEVKKEEQKSGIVDLGNMTPSQRLAYLNLNPRGL